jgi:hypothetical protein
MHLSSPARWCLLILAWLPGWLPARAAEPDPAMAELRQAGIEPSRQGVQTFLESLRLTPEREAKIRALLADLGSTRYRTREKATEELSALPGVPRRLLQEAAGRDLETRKRVERILAEPQYAEWESKLLLALRVIEAERIKGLAPLVLELMPEWPDPYLAQAAAQAVEASAERSDGKALREVIAHGRLRGARIAAVRALAAVLGREAEPELDKLLTDADHRVRVAAATALLNQGNRASLSALVRLLESDQAEVRHAAAAVLRAVSGKQFDGTEDNEPKRRAEAVAAWRDWVARDGPTARLSLPVRTRPLTRGRIVVAVFAERLVREIDVATGRTVFEGRGFTYPWGCHATAEGHRLAVDYSQSFVVEYDAQGKECWRQRVPGNPTSVERLPGGRTLLALAEPGVVVELDRSGKVVWEVRPGGRPTTAQRLANGNTLVNLQNDGKVVEITRRGTVVWQVTGLRTPHTAEQLADGHVLVCDMAAPGAVLEFDRSGKVVWSKRDLDNPAQAQRLANGNTLIAVQNALEEFNPQGKLVRRYDITRSRFFAY